MASIRKRNGSYQIIVSCGYDINGKKIIETTTFHPDSSLTPKKQDNAAKAFAQQFESRIRNGYAMDGRKITLKEFSVRWLEEYAKNNLQPGTVAKYKEELGQKILPSLGHLKLTEIKPHLLNSFYNSMLQDGARKDRKPGGYSHATIRKTHNVLSSLLRTATAWEVIESNPCNKVKVPSAPDIAEHIKFFTPAQAATFLAYIEQPYDLTISAHSRTDDTGKGYSVGDYTIQKSLPLQIQVLFNLAIYTGMRKGELLALEWSDINFEADLISISKSVGRVNGKTILKSPKTKTSFRKVSIPHSLTQKLEKLLLAQKTYRLDVGEYWQGTNWIFTQGDGTMMNYSTPYHALQAVIKRYNKNRAKEEQLPVIPFHGLRHTSATLMIASQQDIKTISHRLGHAQSSTTLNIYTHALQEGDRRAAAALESLIHKQT